MHEKPSWVTPRPNFAGRQPLTDLSWCSLTSPGAHCQAPWAQHTPAAAEASCVCVLLLQKMPTNLEQLSSNEAIQNLVKFI